jgi:hypothetical protein
MPRQGISSDESPVKIEEYENSMILPCRVRKKQSTFSMLSDCRREMTEEKSSEKVTSGKEE